MSSGYPRSTDPIEQLAARISTLEARIHDLERQPMILPVRESDPPETDPTNIWMFPDGRIRARHLNVAGTAYTTREWVTSAPGSGTSGSAPAAPAEAPQTYRSSWSATWSQSYRQSGAARTDDGATRLYYGYVDSYNGRNRSLCGFDYGAIATALSGSTITNVALYMINLHTWYNAGGSTFLGIHNFSAEPATWAGGGIPRSMISQQSVPDAKATWLSLPLEFATMIRDGTGKGIAFESPDNSATHYGYAAGVGSGYTVPQLWVDYAK